MLEPFNINKHAKKDPEDILFENLYQKFGSRFSEYRKRYSDNIKGLDLDIKTKFPNTVILELVNRCDLECVMCYQGFRNDAKKSTLDEKLLDKIFSEFKKNISPLKNRNIENKYKREWALYSFIFDLSKNRQNTK